MIIDNFIIALFVLLGLILMIVYYFMVILPAEDRLTHRIQSLGFSRRGGLNENMSTSLIAIKETRLEKRLNNFLKKDRYGYGWVRLKLLRSGINQSLERLIALFSVTWIIVGISAFFLIHLSVMKSVLYALATTIGLSHMLLKRYEEKRKKMISEHLAPAIEIILRGVRAGSQIDKTFRIVAREVPSPLKEEFEQINSEIDFGADFDKVLHASALRVNIPDYYFFITSLIIQRRTGGSLGDVLENIIATLNKSHELRLKIKVFSSEAKTSGYVLSGLPVIAILALLKIKPEQIEFFLHDPLGQTLFLTAGCLIILAMVTIRRMIRMDV
ncbi:MAG: type II secretion system F family protein [Candidatus Paracaedibacteraceae bacterium]|nr:type II secretion system F family protein [Candidatus Paracaedibacteraceae bacterium]